MTNREWIESLSDEKLANFLYGIAAYSKFCDIAYCDKIEDEGGNFVRDLNCKEGVRKWLQAEHKGENHDE